MVRYLVWLGSLLLIVTFMVQSHYYPQLQFNSLQQRILHPLDHRVRYRIGEIDPRFGLSEQEVKNLAQRATYIWQRDTGKSWFVYDKNARLTVNFIFDERQQTTLDYQKTRQDIQQMKHHQQQNAQTLEQNRANLDREFNALQAEIRQLNQQYDYLNAQFQNTLPEHRAQLHAQLTQLEQQKHFLQAKAQSFESNQQRFNQQVQQYNQHAQQVDNAIHQANIKFRPREFHKGVFNGREINIYEYQSQDDLLLTLAHEFGHALDLDHNDDPTALMYPMAQKQDLANFRLKPADIKMLER